MPLTLKEFKGKYNSVYPNNDLTNSQLADYYYLKFLRDFEFDENVKKEKFPLYILLGTSPIELKSLLNNIENVKTRKYPLLPWLYGFDEKKLVYQKYYPNSKLTDRILLPLFQLLTFKKYGAHSIFYKNFSEFNSPLIKYGAYDPADFEKLNFFYLLYNKPQSDSELKAVFELFYHLNPFGEFEEYFRKKNESNLRKKMPFLNMYDAEIKEEAERIGKSISKSNLDVKNHIIELSKHIVIKKKKKKVVFQIHYYFKIINIQLLIHMIKNHHPFLMNLK